MEQALSDISLRVTDQMTAGDLLVGIGTLALALFTAWLAQRTSREVRLNEANLALTRESIEALDRPFVIASPSNLYKTMAFREFEEHPGMRFIYCLWNVGKGPAIVDQVALLDRRGVDHLAEMDSIQRAIAVDGVRDEITPVSSDGLPGPGYPTDELKLQISYRSASGRRYMTESMLMVTSDLLCTCRNFRRVEPPS